MVEMKHTLTFDKIRTSENILSMVRDWARGKDLTVEDDSIIKVIGSKAQIDELEAKLKPHQEAAKAAPEKAGS